MKFKVIIFLMACSCCLFAQTEPQSVETIHDQIIKLEKRIDKVENQLNTNPFDWNDTELVYTEGQLKEYLTTKVSSISKLNSSFNSSNTKKRGWSFTGICKLFGLESEGKKQEKVKRVWEYLQAL